MSRCCLCHKIVRLASFIFKGALYCALSCRHEDRTFERTLRIEEDPVRLGNAQCKQPKNGAAPSVRKRNLRSSNQTCAMPKTHLESHEQATGKHGEWEGGGMRIAPAWGILYRPDHKCSLSCSSVDACAKILCPTVHACRGACRCQVSLPPACLCARPRLAHCVQFQLVYVDM